MCSLTQPSITDIHWLDPSSFSAPTVVLSLRLCTVEVAELKLAAPPCCPCLPWPVITGLHCSLGASCSKKHVPEIKQLLNLTWRGRGVSLFSHFWHLVLRQLHLGTDRVENKTVGRSSRLFANISLFALNMCWVVFSFHTLQKGCSWGGGSPVCFLPGCREALRPYLPVALERALLHGDANPATSPELQGKAW